MHCICRCACKLHGRHLTTCHVQDLFFLFFFTPLFLFWAISEEPWSHLHTSLTVTHQSLIHHPAAKDEVTPTHRTGDRGARLCQSEPASLVSGTQSCAARPPAWQAAVSEDSPARCCCQKQATAGSIRPVTHPSSTCGRPWQLLHFPRADVKNKQTVPVHVLALLLQLCVSPPPLLFFFTCCEVSVHSSTPGVRAAPSHPPTNQPAQPLLPISGVTSPCGYELFSDTIIDQRSPMLHRCMRCCSSCSRADARKLRANTPLERRDAAHVRARACVFSPLHKPPWAWLVIMRLPTVNLIVKFMKHFRITYGNDFMEALLRQDN